METDRDRRRPKILCIDDDPAVSAALAARLGRFDVDVCAAFFGTHGIWLAVTEKPDLIITDMRMSNGTGDYVVDCLKARADTRSIPILVLTGRRDRETEHAMRMRGVQNYLHKPIRFDRLLAAVKQHVSLEPAACDSAACDSVTA